MNHLLRILLVFVVLGQTACVRNYLAHCKVKGKKKYHEHLYLGSSIDLQKQADYTLTEDSDNLLYELSTVVQQKPNQKILVFRPRMWIYIANDSFNRFHQPYCNDSGAYAKPEVYPRRRDKGGKVGAWALRKVGEKPVVLDLKATERSATSMRYYLNHKGYYDAEVSYRLRYRRHTARVQYLVKTGKRMMIDSVFYESPDTQLLRLVKEFPKKDQPLRADEPLDRNVFDQEKAYLTDKLRNQGYFLFTPTSISFEADTINVRKVEPRKKPFWKYWTMGIQGEPRANIYVKIAPFSDTVLTHPRFYLNQVYIQPDEDVVFSSNRRQFLRDTLYVAERLSKRDAQPLRKVLPSEVLASEGDSLIQQILYIRQRMRSFAPLFLAKLFTLRAGQGYQVDLFRENIRRMTEIDIFKTPRIDYYPSKNGDPNALDCFIRFRPARPWVLGLDTEVNNNNANFGGSVNLSARNRNIFRGGESFVIKAEGSIDFRLGADSTVRLGGQQDNTWLNLVNLLDLNLESNLYFPRFLGWSSASLRSDIQAPTTRMSLGYRYLRQSSVFTVSTFTAKYGYQWSTNKIHQFILNPVQINFALRPSLDPIFEQRLARSNRALLASLQEQFFIPGADFSYTYNRPDVKTNHVFYAKVYTEWAGHLLRLANLLRPNEPFKIFGSDYSQYLKLDLDLRYSYRWSRKTSLVTRLLLGAIRPFGQTAERPLPFSRRFFMGGPSSMRAWRLRQLGPGAVESVAGAEFQQGDIRIEWNFEYRRKLNSWIALALFTDVGNIWLWRPEGERPNLEPPLRTVATGVLTWDFYREMAVSLGTGLRLDFSFFIFRLDLAMQFYNPAGYGLLDTGRRQYLNFNPFAAGRNNWIIGIGYPF